MREARGEVYIIRYADDFVVGFQYGEDGKKFNRQLRQRLSKFGLTLHEGKTRLIEFGRFAADNREKQGVGKPESFDFLGFTHVCDTRITDGKFKLTHLSISNMHFTLQVGELPLSKIIQNLAFRYNPLHQSTTKTG